MNTLTSLIECVFLEDKILKYQLTTQTFADYHTDFC